jgi:protein TonB
MKQRQWLVPTAVALSFHALLLFGFRSGHIVPPPHPPAPGLTGDPVPPQTVQIEATAVPEDSFDSDPVSSPAPAVPVIIEPPPSNPVDKITIPQNDRVVTSVNHAPVKLFGPPGEGDGIGSVGGPHHGPVPSSWLDNIPRTRAQLAPVYPYEARVAGRPGEVWVEFTVDEAGRVLAPHVLRSTDPVFETPTLQAVAKWRFEPGRKDGRVVRFRMAVPVAFAVNP